MKRGVSVLVLSLCCLLLLARAAMAADITDPILKKLVEKGILTEQEAKSVMKEMEKEPAGEQKAAEVSTEEKKDLGKIAKALKGIKIGGLWYLSYQNGETGNTTGVDTRFNTFAVKRGYLTVEKEFSPWFQARITSDVTTMKDSTNNMDGSLTLRLKYIYGQFNIPDIAFLTKPNVEFGMVHMPWLDYEEHTNYYRLQDTMFIERNGILNSADIGLTFSSLLGGLMDEDYRKNVNSAYAGRYGSVQTGIYDGGGYAASEKNRNKVFEGRLTVRPLPDIIPGLQFSYFGTTGKGNTDIGPNWTTNIAFGSYESEPIVLTGQYYWGKGQQNGANETKKDGYSLFTELKLYNIFKDTFNRFSVIGRYDHFDPDTTIKDNENSRYIAGVAYYLDKPHNNMVLLDYDTVNYKKSGMSDDKRIQLTLQVAF